ncbi:MAG: hypothetical protein ABEJ74_03865 [Haloferacaceae archaeon]
MDATRRTFLGTAIGISTVALAGCSGTSGDGGGADGDGAGGGSGGSTPTATPTETSSPAPTEQPGGGMGATVRTRSHPEYGAILTDADGMTLYMFEKDTKDDPASACTGGCASNWPPLTVDGEPTKDESVTASLSTFERESGETHVAAAGWPLYYYAPDSQPGDAKGQGVGDVWWVLAPDGSPIRSTDSGGNGY